MVSMFFLKSLPLFVLKYSLHTELVKACMVLTYFLKSLPHLVLKYAYCAGEGVHGDDVLPEELATLGSEVFLLSW
jgi:hypothetical protein